jgi:hypothetical protein
MMKQAMAFRTLCTESIFMPTFRREQVYDAV